MTDNEIYHYGVMGMRWGRRRTKNTSSTTGNRKKNNKSKTSEETRETGKEKVKKMLKTSGKIVGVSALISTAAYAAGGIILRRTLDKISNDFESPLL